MERAVSASQRTSAHQQRAPERSIAERTQVRNVLKAMQHALRAIPQYGQGSPASARAVESLRETLRAVWKTHGFLAVYFQDEGIWVDTGNVTAAVSAESGRSESPLQGFRDAGFHSLTFLRGFENEELPRFLAIASREFPADCLDDLATALWFEGFNSLQFTLNDGLFDAEYVGAGNSPEIDKSAATAGAPDDPPPLPEALLTHPLTSHELQLASQETNHLEELIAEELRRPVCSDVLSALLDSLQDGEEPLRAEILCRLDSLLPLLLERGCLREISTMMLEMRALADAHQELGRSFCTAVLRTLSQFERSAVVAQYLQDLEEGEIVPDLEALSRFTRSLGHASAKTLVRIAERAKSKPIATLFRDACESAVERDPDLLLDLLRSDDDVVLRGALSLVTASRSDEAVRDVIRLLRHRDARMRLVAAKSLLNVGREEALHALMCSLDDDNEDVRQTCAWALSTWEYRPAFEAIQDILEGPLLPGMALTEKLTYFDAYARLGGNRAVPYLADILQARHLFRPRYETDLRACAARGLGQIPGIEARQALQTAVEDRDPKVRRIVTRQLRGAKP